MTLASLCSCAGRFESYLVANPKTGFLMSRLILNSSVRKCLYFCSNFSLCLLPQHNDPKFSDRQVWANSVGRSSLIRIDTVCIFWTHYSIIKPHCSNFRTITAIFQLSECLAFLQFCKNPKILDAQKVCCNHPKIWTSWLYHRIMRPKGADAKAQDLL